MFSILQKIQAKIIHAIQGDRRLELLGGVLLGISTFGQGRGILKNISLVGLRQISFRTAVLASIWSTAYVFLVAPIVYILLQVGMRLGLARFTDTFFEMPYSEYMLGKNLLVFLMFFVISLVLAMIIRKEFVLSFLFSIMGGVGVFSLVYLAAVICGESFGHILWFWMRTRRIPSAAQTNNKLGRLLNCLILIEVSLFVTVLLIMGQLATYVSTLSVFLINRPALVFYVLISICFIRLCLSSVIAHFWYAYNKKSLEAFPNYNESVELDFILNLRNKSFVPVQDRR